VHPADIFYTLCCQILKIHFSVDILSHHIAYFASLIVTGLSDFGCFVLVCSVTIVQSEEIRSADCYSNMKQVTLGLSVLLLRN
jgi:hypothetical protein